MYFLVITLCEARAENVGKDQTQFSLAQLYRPTLPVGSFGLMDCVIKCIEYDPKMAPPLKT